MSQIKSALANQQAAIAGIRTELTAAEKQFVRIEGLYRAGGASQADYDNASLAVERLQKSLEEASNSLNYSQQQEESLSETLKIALSNQKQLTVRSPIEGKLMYLACEKGQVITPGTPVAGVAVMGELEIKADVLSDDIAEITEGQDVLITAPVLGNTILQGQVIRVYPQAEEKMSALGVIQRRVPVIISLAEAGILKPGFEVRVEINTVKKENVLILPRETVRKNQKDKEEVVLVVNGKTVSQVVKTGLYDSNNTEILSGLQEGDQVVKNAGSDFVPGTKVRISP